MKRSTVATLFHIALVCLSILVMSGCSKFYLCFWAGGDWDEEEGECYAPGQGPSKGAVCSPGETLFVSATAHASGAQGTNWRSDVEIHNLGDEAATIGIWLLEHGADNSTPVHQEFALAPSQSLRLADILLSEFGIEGQAALRLSPSSGRILATSRTYNLLGEDNQLGLPAGSTFGQYIPAQPLGEAIRSGEQGRLIGLMHSLSTDSGFRTNLGVVNARAEDLQVTIELRSAEGEILHTVVADLPPLGFRQFNRVYDGLDHRDVEGGSAVIRATTPNALFFAYASVVDNLTGDPVAITAERLPEALPAGHGEPVYIVAAAHNTGAAGTNWRTDVDLHGLNEARGTWVLLEAGKDNSCPQSRTFDLSENHTGHLEDVLETYFGYEGAAALRFTPAEGRIQVSSRTYNLLGEGNPLGLPTGATFGQFIPGLTERDAIHFGEEGRLIQLSHTPGGTDGFRTNLVLLSASVDDIDVEVELYDAEGVLLGVVDRSLLPYEYQQLNRVFKMVTGGIVDDGYAVVRTTTDGGAVFALASVVDNLTGDPVGMGAPVILSAEADALLDAVEGHMGVLAVFGLDTFVDRIQLIGVTEVLDSIVAANAGVASRTGDTVVIDNGTGYIAPDGTFRTGMVTVDMSGLSVNDGGITGTMSVIQDEFEIDGEPIPIGSSSWTFDLSERGNGTVVGDIVVGPADGRKSQGSLSGTIGIDTEICVDYPISGSLTAELDGETVTIIFTPDCNGTVDHEVSPGGDDPVELEGDFLAIEWSFTGGSSRVGTVDSTTGEWATVGSSGFPRANAMAKSPEGVYYSMTESGTGGTKRLMVIDPGSGAGTVLAEISGMSNAKYIGGLAFLPNSTLVAVVPDNTTNTLPCSELWTVNPGSGAASLVGPIEGFRSVSALEYDETNGTLYGWSADAGLITINPATGAGSDVNTAVSGTNMMTIAVLPDGKMFGAQHALYSIDKRTGEASQVGASNLSNVRGMVAVEP
jgi:hypothetical protein